MRRPRRPTLPPTPPTMRPMQTARPKEPTAGSPRSTSREATRPTAGVLDARTQKLAAALSDGLSDEAMGGADEKLRATKTGAMLDHYFQQTRKARERLKAQGLSKAAIRAKLRHMRASFFQQARTKGLVTPSTRSPPLDEADAAPTQACPPVDAGKNCDEWIESDGYTCDALTSQGYDCTGCTCPAQAPTAEEDTTTPAPIASGSSGQAVEAVSS